MRTMDSGRRRSVCGLVAVALACLLAGSPVLARYASIVVDADSGRVLHAKNADTRNHPASLTKLMTLYLAFEALDAGRLRLDQALPVSRRAAGQAPSRLGLKAGESITVRQAILALVTKSANDAATVMAEALAGSEQKFARAMTAKARALGMNHTSFRNASGLPNRRQLSSARDVATLALALRRDFPHRYGYFATRKFRFRGKSYRNHNKLLAEYPGTDGLKTGYIRASGFNVVASVERDGRRLVGVVLGGKSPRSRNRHMMQLFDRTFRRLRGYAPPARPPVTTAWSAPRPSPKPAPPAAVAAAPRGAWGIQVGAYRSETRARRAVSLARQDAGSVLAATRGVITRVKVRGRRLFRARLVGLNRAQAQRACRLLRPGKLDCATVPPVRSTQLAKTS